MNPLELTLAVVMVGVGAAIATGYLRLPVELTSSSVAIAFMLIVVLALFSYSPVVGIAGIVLLAILVFSRNVAKVVQFTEVTRETQPRRKEYGDMNIANQEGGMMPYSTSQSGPRDYSQFRETTPSVWMPSFSEGFTSDQIAPYNTFGGEQYAVGQYPIDNQRTWANPMVEEYKFRPSLDTGSNDFQRHGPNMDQKVDALVYQ